jgi:hypothetical protein
MGRRLAAHQVRNQQVIIAAPEHGDPVANLRLIYCCEHIGPERRPEVNDVFNSVGARGGEPHRGGNPIRRSDRSIPIRWSVIGGAFVDLRSSINSSPPVRSRKRAPSKCRIEPPPAATVLISLKHRHYQDCSTVRYWCKRCSAHQAVGCAVRLVWIERATQ